MPLWGSITMPCAWPASSFQLSLVDLPREAVRLFIEGCALQGLHIKWFGADEPAGFTSVWTHWRYFGQAQTLPQAQRVLGGLCDLRLPLVLSHPDCEAMAAVIRACLSSVVARCCA